MARRPGPPGGGARGKVGDGLSGLLFLTQLGENQLWKNGGQGKFTNISDAAGIGMRDAVSVGYAFADIDNDGLPDLFVTTVRHGNRLFHNLGGGKFEDTTAKAGDGYVGHSSGAVFFAHDGDSLLDLFVTDMHSDLFGQPIAPDPTSSASRPTGRGGRARTT